MVSEVIREREEPREERWTKTGIQECRDAGFSTAKGERGGHGEVWRRGTTVMRRPGAATRPKTARRIHVRIREAVGD
jgi:hypothetical protein